jgi:hypothetical protein
MSTREAACSCGRLRAEVSGDPVRITLCHCLACQRRTGSPFGAAARFPSARVTISGDHTEYVRRADDHGDERRFRFCPACGSTVFYTTEDDPEMIAIPIGAFADPAFPPPTMAVYGSRQHPWVELSEEVERGETWDALRPLYEAGDYEQVADRGAGLIAEHPRYGYLLYNVACCESLAGRPQDAIGHLRRAFERSESFRMLARTDPDLDPIRNQPAFQELIS